MSFKLIFALAVAIYGLQWVLGYKYPRPKDKSHKACFLYKPFRPPERHPASAAGSDPV